MMKEIGGYFQIERNTGSEYHEEYIALNTGRNALVYLMKAKHMRKVYLPNFLCESVRLACEEYGFEYELYHIDKNFMPCFDKTLRSDEYLYIVNYYGQIDEKKAIRLKCRYGNIILDNSHAFFMKAPKGIDTIYTCRKYFGVPDGAYLATDTVIEEELEQDKSFDRMMHLFGRFEDLASNWYAEYRKNEEKFRQVPLKTMSSITHNLLRGIDYKDVINKRNCNFAILANELKKSNHLNVKKSIGPFAYPYYTKDYVRLRKVLIENKIYVATLWPNVAKDTDSMAGELAKCILPLPCDHRYSEKDMIYICEILRR